MKAFDVKLSTYTDFSKDISDKDPKFKIGDIVRISKYKDIFAKDHVSNWSEEAFVDTAPWMLLVILKSKKLLEVYTKKSCKKKAKRV